MAETAVIAPSRPARLVAPAQAPLELTGRSAAAARMLELVRRAGQADTSVLIVGEVGTDVDSVARELNKQARAGAAPWIEIECAAADRGALDRAIFGTVADGVATDLEAVAADSLIVAARGGTLFLRDVTELPASAQARLARLVRDREVRVDGDPVPTHMRIIATASPALDAEVRANRFRGDLYRRLAACRIDVPALRDRAEDIPELAGRLLEQASADGLPRTFTHAALALLAALGWPGNLAELSAVVGRAATYGAPEGVIQVEHVLPALNLDRAHAPHAPAGSLREARLRFERDYIASVLQHHGWRMADAARTLGIQRPNLYRKAKQLGIPVARLSE